ncbi:MAG: hypothetical protein IH934_04645 [Nanoarchaeota archaeon]|nr:hypothetical protein [Nanoarchaeota archaeon]
MSAYIGYIKIGLLIIIIFVASIKVWAITQQMMKKIKGKKADFETYEQMMR